MERTTSAVRFEGGNDESREDRESMPPTLPCPRPFVRIAPMRAPLRTVTEYRYVHESREPVEEANKRKAKK